MRSFYDMTPHDRLEHITALAGRALPLYGLEGRADIRLLNHSENTTFLVKTPDGGASVLRINRPGYHAEPTLEAEITWLKALIADGTVGTAAPLAGTDGHYIQRIPLDGYREDLNCALFEFLKGSAPEENESTLVGEFEKLGAVTARLHNQVKRWPESRKLDRPHWDFAHTLGETPRWGRVSGGLGMTRELDALFERVARVIGRRLAAYGMGPERYGLIHADLRLANLLVDEGEVKVIDFDDCGYGWFMYDLAAALSFIEHEPYVPDLVAAWLRGYGRVAPLSGADVAEVPTFIMLRRLMLVAWLGSHHETETAGLLGPAYTEATAPLAEAYLSDHN
ncbi:MAG: phosphotransferase enzyme family protein [Desulfovibrionaceae bacterium]